MSMWSAMFYTTTSLGRSSPSLTSNSSSRSKISSMTVSESAPSASSSVSGWMVSSGTSRLLASNLATVGNEVMVITNKVNGMASGAGAISTTRSSVRDPRRRSGYAGRRSRRFQPRRLPLIVQRDDVVAIMQYHFALDRRGDGALDQVGALGAGDVVLFGVDDQGWRCHLAELAPHLLDQAVRLEDALGRQARSAGGRRVADGHFAGDPGAQVFVFQAVGIALAVGIHPAQRRVIRQRQQEAVFGDAP